MRPRSVTAVRQPLATIQAGLANESVFTLWISLSVLHSEAPPRAIARSHVLECASLDEASRVSVCKLLRISAEQLDQLAGKDMVQARHLRYCRFCLHAGYHSTVFQHPAIGHCPVHGTVLREECGGCGHALFPTFSGGFKQGLACDRCGKALARSVRHPKARQEAEWVDQMLGARRRQLRTDRHADSIAKWLQSAARQSRGGGVATASRHFQRAWIWPNGPDPLWTAAREERYPVHFLVAGRRDSGPMHRQVAALFRRLLMLCGPHAETALRICRLAGSHQGGLRLLGPASAISVALYKFCAFYDLLKNLEFLGETPATVLSIGRDGAPLPFGTRLARVGCPAPEQGSIDARLYELEMLSMFAKLLVRERSATPLVEISLADMPSPIEFAPAWKISRDGIETEFCIHYRADWKTVERLLRRRWRDVHPCAQMQLFGEGNASNR